ncbi:zinc finger protein-like [Tropilaelaps mercedesae]|uniref:Zinc finger protein-like n=1 Tax=Tropilaelaps mercedesae TaxID=418985 RepID=A0A1V9X269_9ACAR|nr:zinc finger protein-like [Tropilaelaps mercedesae]
MTSAAGPTDSAPSMATVTSIIVVRDECSNQAESERPLRQHIIKFDQPRQREPQLAHLPQRQVDLPREEHQLEQQTLPTAQQQTVVVEAFKTDDESATVVGHHAEELLDAAEQPPLPTESVVVETSAPDGSTTFDEFDALGLTTAAAPTGCSSSAAAGGGSAGTATAAGAPAAVEINQDAMIMFTVPADDWKAHMTRKEREFVCRLCPYIAQYQHHYVGHFYTHHATTKPHQCGLCLKTFPLASTLKRHVATVHVAAKFACDVCGKVFPRRDAFNFHVKTHLSRQADSN